ncbi:MAG: MlaD family protein, partial [Bacteroidota bacterium]
MKLKISNETRVALLAIAAVAFGFWGFQFLKGRNILTPSQTFFVRYANVDQLRPSSPVFIKGLQVGMVKRLYVDPETYKSIVVQLTIESGVDIPKDAVATIVGLSLMGGKAIEIVVDHPCEGNCAEDGDFLQGASKNFLESVIGDPTQIDAYTARIRAGLDINIDSLAKINPGGIAGTVDALDNSLKNLERVTAELDEILRMNKKSIGIMADNFAAVSSTVKANDRNISDALANLADVTRQLKVAGLDKTAQKASGALDSITLSLNTLRQTLNTSTSAIGKVDSLAERLLRGEGTVGKALTEEDLYNNIVSTTRHLHLLLQDLRMHPERYTNVRVKLLGKNKPSKYANPVDDPAYQILVDSLERDY